MIAFTLKIAGFPIGVTVNYPSTKEFCREFLSHETPELFITVTEADLTAEQEKSRESDVREGISPVRVFSRPYLETLALYRKIANALLSRNVLLFHSSAVALDGKAYLFTARSGTGKTTHTRLWLKNIPGSYVLNGDKPLLLFRDDGVYVCGTPWQGKEGYGVNEILPLGGICILERDTVNHIEPIRALDVFSTLLAQTHRPDKSLPTVVGLLGKLNEVSIYRLGCNMEDEAALVSWRGMCCREDTPWSP